MVDNVGLVGATAVLGGIAGGKVPPNRGCAGDEGDIGEVDDVKS